MLTSMDNMSSANTSSTTLSSSTSNNLSPILKLPSELIEVILGYVFFDSAHICPRCSRSRVSRPFVQLTQPICFVNKTLHVSAVRFLLRIATLCIEISAVTADPRKQYGEAVTMDVSIGMKTSGTTPLAALRDWPLWKEVVHYHLTIPATGDIIDVEKDWYYHRLHGPSVERENRRYRIREQGCRDAVNFLSEVPLIKSLTVSLKFDDQAEVEAALYSLLKLRNVEKARLLIEKDEPIHSGDKSRVAMKWNFYNPRARNMGFRASLGESSQCMGEEDLREWEEDIRMKK